MTLYILSDTNVPYVTHLSARAGRRRRSRADVACSGRRCVYMSDGGLQAWGPAGSLQRASSGGEPNEECELVAGALARCGCGVADSRGLCRRAKTDRGTRARAIGGAPGG